MFQSIASSCGCQWLLHLSSDNLLSPKGVSYEVTALMAVKIKLKDELNVMNGWDINSVDPCTWNMVACSTEDMALCGGPGGLVPMPTTQREKISRAGLSNDFEMLWATAGYASPLWGISIQLG
nr:putative lrr receptor-like serine/threonine-protein kinase [Quercus suber]